MSATKRRSEAIWIESKSYWQIKVQHDGVRKAFTSSQKGRKGKHEAEAKADKWLEEGTSDMRFDAAWETFLQYKKTHTGTSNWKQLECYGRMYILPNIKNVKLDSITPVKWQSCIDCAYAKGLSKRTCGNIRAAISAFVVHARRERWTISPIEEGDLIVPKDAPVGKRSILQPDDLKLLFTESTIQKNGRPSPSHYIHAWRFMVLTGLRRGELCGLRNEDIQDNVVHIQRSINEQLELTRGKNDNANRWFVLSTTASQILSEQKEHLRKCGIISPWVFPDKFGEQTNPKHLYEYWRTYRDQHGIKSSLHELRHTFISAVKTQMPLPLLKSLVGHSESMDTYGVYGHQMDGEMLETANIIDDVFSRILDAKA